MGGADDGAGGAGGCHKSRPSHWLVVVLLVGLVRAISESRHSQDSRVNAWVVGRRIRAIDK